MSAYAPPSTRYVVTTVTGFPISTVGSGHSRGGRNMPVIAQVLDTAYNWRLVEEFKAKGKQSAVARAQRKCAEMNADEGLWEAEVGPYAKAGAA